MYKCILSANVTDETALVHNEDIHPGISGFAHNESAYCVDCAIQNSIGGLANKHKTWNQEHLPPNTKQILPTEVWDYPAPSCDICNIKLQVQVIHYQDCECGHCVNDGDLL